MKKIIVLLMVVLTVSACKTSHTSEVIGVTTIITVDTTYIKHIGYTDINIKR